MWRPLWSGFRLGRLHRHLVRNMYIRGNPECGNLCAYGTVCGFATVERWRA